MKNTQIRMEGLTLTVADVRKSVEFYTDKMGFKCDWNAAPDFALIRVPEGGTIGLLSAQNAAKDGAEDLTRKQRLAIHIELSTDHLDELYQELLARGVEFNEPPHDEPWERSATALDPDGYPVEIAQGRRGKKN